MSGIRHAVVLILGLALVACGGGGGGGGGNGDDGGSVVGDDARRAILADIGEEIILPAVRDFDDRTGELQSAADALAAAPGDNDALEAARAAWDAAMSSWQRNEVLQVGPAGRSANPDSVAGGQDFRDRIYSWPLTLDFCGIEAAAEDGDEVNGNTPINRTGLGAIEYLLFTSEPPDSCAAEPDGAERAAHVQRLADWLALLATTLRERWEPDEGNFIEQWSTAGLDSSVFYSRPQDAFNALSIALFYAEKVTKDRKVAYTTGLPAAGLVCNENQTSCPEFLESRLSRRSGENLAINIQAFRDVFTGVDDNLGLNDLLEGIDRADLADEIVDELDAVLAHLDTIENDQGFDTAVEEIDDRDECVNAFSSSSGLPPCALLGFMKTAMDTFRGPVVATLSLAVPSSAAGDND